MDNVLVDIVGTPISGRYVVPFTFGILRMTLDETFIKARNEMDAADNVIGIDEPKCALICQRVCNRQQNRYKNLKTFTILELFTLGARAYGN